MTDKQKWKDFLSGYQITFDDTSHSRLILISENDPAYFDDSKTVQCYPGFYVQIEFDENEKFTSMGAYDGEVPKDN